LGAILLKTYLIPRVDILADIQTSYIIALRMGVAYFYEIQNNTYSILS
jgi:hypothetical protein